MKEIEVVENAGDLALPSDRAVMPSAPSPAVSAVPVSIPSAPTVSAGCVGYTLPDGREFEVDLNDDTSPSRVLMRAAEMAYYRGGGTHPISDYDIRNARQEITGEIDEIARLRRESLRFRKALAPFAKALEDWGEDKGQPDRWNVWEHPVAMNVTLGDFRRAASAMSARSDETGTGSVRQDASAVPQADAQ